MNSVIIIIGIIRYILNYVACATILRFRALLCQVACATFVRALAYCNFLKEVRLGGWSQTRKCVRYQYIISSLKRLGQVAGARQPSACATMLRLRALLCYVVCATFVHALVYCNFVKEVRLVGWDKTRKCVRYYTQVACATMLGCVRHLCACTSIL